MTHGGYPSGMANKPNIHLPGDTTPESISIEDRFPVLKEHLFFNHAAVSPIPASAAQALEGYARSASAHPAQRGQYDAAGQVRMRGAELIGASPAEIATIPNTSTGLALVAHGLDWHPGDAVVSTAIEFPANRFVWEDLRRRGVTVTFVEPAAHGQIVIDDLVKAMADTFRPGGTNVLAISLVQYATGQRLDAAQLAQAAHDYGGLLCLDAIQAVGAMPVNVEQDGVDFLSADGHKWMLGPEGVGLFYCRHEHLQRLHPMVAGWLSMEGWHDAMIGNEPKFEFRKDARRFEPGTWNVGGMIALAASMSEILTVGIPEVWRRIDALNEQIRAGSVRLGLRVYSSVQDGARSGIVVLECPDGSPDADVIEKELTARGIDVAARGGRIRVSPHFYNTPSQVDRFLAALGDILK